MNNKKTKLSLLVLGTSVIGAATLALVASQPEVVQKEQVTTINPQIEPTEALNGVTHTESSTNLGSPSLETPISEAPQEGVGLPNKYLTEFDAQADKAQTGANIQLHLPADFQTLDIENCWHEKGIWEIHFRLSNNDVVEVIGSFNTADQLEVISLTVRTLQVNDIDIPLNGWKVTMLKKDTNWLFNLAKGNIDTAFNIAPEFAAEMKGQLNNDFDTDAGDDEVINDEVVTEVIEPVREPLSWRASFGVSDELAPSESPKFIFPKITYPPKRIEQVDYQAPVIEVPSQNLGVLSSRDWGNWLDDEPVTPAGPQLPPAFASLDAYDIYEEEGFFNFKFSKNDLEYEVLGYLAAGGTSKMKVNTLKINNRAVYTNGWTIVLFERRGKLGFDFTKQHSDGTVNLEEQFHSIEEGITWVNLITYTPRLARDDPTTWNYDTSDKLTDRILSKNKINLRHSKYDYATDNPVSNYYTLTVKGTNYHLEYASQEVGSETYRMFIIKPDSNGDDEVCYIHPKTGKELGITNLEGVEFKQGSHGKMYEIARKHQNR